MKTQKIVLELGNFFDRTWRQLRTHSYFSDLAPRPHGSLKKKIYASIIIFNQQNPPGWEICD